MQTTQGHDII